MELLEGESLSTHRRRIGVLSEARAVALCAGRSVIRWAVAHGKGIVHHDLRPDSIFMVRGGPGSPTASAKISIAASLSWGGAPSLIYLQRRQSGQSYIPPLPMRIVSEICQPGVR